MGLNEFDSLRYEEAKRTPLDDIAAGYAKSNNFNQEKPSDSVEALRERYRKDKDSLSPIELLTLGMADINAKNQKEAEERQKAVNDYMKPYHKAKKEDEEFILTNSEEFKKLAKQLAELQAEFQKLNGVSD